LSISILFPATRIPDNKEEAVLDSATPFAYGAGHVQPNHAADPGLIYDLTVNDYLNFLCARGASQKLIRRFSGGAYACPNSFRLTDFNYPSISVPNLPARSVTVTRTVTNVGSPNTSYVVRVNEPAGVLVSVNPKILTFKAVGEKKTFKATLMPNGTSTIMDYVFGELVWSDGKHHVRSPIAVRSSNYK
jgi:hypothetical protein